MTIAEAQRELRRAYLGGFAGQLVSGTLWLVSAALATWGTRRAAIVALVVGGAFIYPLTVLLLRALGRRTTLSPQNSLDRLAMQIAFTVPLSLPLVGAATLYRADWFYPAMMLVVGVHYLPFVFLYGLPHYAALAALMIGGALAIGMYVPGNFALAGWITGALLVGFAIVLRASVAAEEKGARASVAPASL